MHHAVTYMLLRWENAVGIHLHCVCIHARRIKVAQGVLDCDSHAAILRVLPVELPHMLLVAHLVCPPILCSIEAQASCKEDGQQVSQRLACVILCTPAAKGVTSKCGLNTQWHCQLHDSLRSSSSSEGDDCCCCCCFCLASCNTQRQCLVPLPAHLTALWHVHVSRPVRSPPAQPPPSS